MHEVRRLVVIEDEIEKTAFGRKYGIVVSEAKAGH